MDKVVILFTMKSCPFCHMLKENLDKAGIEYVDRDIDEHSEEYDMFVNIRIKTFFFFIFVNYSFNNII